VPLHGRLFAQWMHHAFPRECPFPHVAGTTNPQAASDWIEQAGSARATKAEMQKIIAAWNAAGPIEDEELTHWTHEEELLVPRSAPHTAGSSLWGGLRNVMFVSALVAVGVGAISTTGKASTTLYGGFDGKAGKLV